MLQSEGTLNIRRPTAPGIQDGFGRRSQWQITTVQLSIPWSVVIGAVLLLFVVLRDYPN